MLVLNILLNLLGLCADDKVSHTLVCVDLVAFSISIVCITSCLAFLTILILLVDKGHPYSKTSCLTILIRALEHFQI